MTGGIGPGRPRPLLLAGTRLTGPNLHLGTFYGWAGPIAEAAGRMDVCVLIADLQSLDVPRELPLWEQTADLEEALHAFLPANVPVVRESAVPSLPQLALLAAQLFAPHHLRRVAPLRRLARTSQAIPMSTLLYPAMMVADVLAFTATHVLAKPEGRFQHADVLNDVLARGAHRYGWPATHLALHPKPTVDIPAADGSRPMKRGHPGSLRIHPVTVDEIRAWTASLPTPGHHQPGRERPHRCPVAWRVWQAVGTHRAADPDRTAVVHEVEHACQSNGISCRHCTAALADAIARDLLGASGSRPDRLPSTAVADQAERNPRRLVRQATGWGQTRSDE